MIYTEEQVMAAWYRTLDRLWNTPNQGALLKIFTGELGKEKQVLFTRDELLDVAATPHEKVMVRGIFAMLGMDMANEAALLAQAREASLGGNMAIVLGLAKARKDENLTPGKTYASADGYLLRRMQGGKWRQYILDSKLLDDDFAVRPLKEI